MEQNLISYIKFSLAIGVGNVTDPSLEEITDEELLASLTQQCYKLGVNPKDISEEHVAELTCLVRKDVYWRMATLNAPLYELQMDGLRVSKHTRFDHYLKLIQEVDKEYLSIKNDPSRVKIQVGEVFIDRYYNKRKQFNSYQIPEVEIMVDTVLDNGYNISIDISKVKPADYIQTQVYFSNEKILDEYEDNKISERARLVFNTFNYHSHLLRVKYEDVNRVNYLLLVVKLKNGLKAFHELEVRPNE